MDTILRKCTKCKIEKELEEFYPMKPSKRCKYNRSNYCKKCERNLKNSRERDAINWDAKVNRFKKKGIILTKELYKELLTKSKGRCEICGTNKCTDKRNRVLSIDHNHDTGKIRGILCGNCNMGLGKFKDSIDLTFKALKYLMEHQ